MLQGSLLQLILPPQDFSILDDANNLLIHHVKRQTSIHKEDKHKIKVLLKHFLMDRFKHPRQELSEDERDEEEDSGKDEAEGDSESGKGSSRRKKAGGKDENSKASDAKAKPDEPTSKSDEPEIKIEPRDGRRTPLHARDMEPVSFWQFFLFRSPSKAYSLKISRANLRPEGCYKQARKNTCIRCQAPSTGLVVNFTYVHLLNWKSA